LKAAYLVVYEGQPEDPQAFLDYYVNRHLPIIWTWPRIRGIEIEIGYDGGDPASTKGGIFMVARFLFDSLDDLRAALLSSGRAQARADRDNLPAFSGTVRHQAVEIQEVPRRDG
jgi:uncharacterized protein (TIGR02118 family)